MSDQTEQPVEEAETEAVTEPAVEQEAPPWGDDFNAERAWQTIQTQRERETELEAKVREYNRLQNDPDAMSAFLEEHGYTFADQEPEPDEGLDEDPGARALAIAEELRQERETEKQEAQQEAHALSVRQIVDEQLEKLGVDEEDGNDILAYAIHALPPKDGIPDIKAAYARFQSREQARQKKWVQSKKAPHTPASGVEGVERLSTDGMSEQAQHEARVERAVARMQAEQG